MSALPGPWKYRAGKGIEWPHLVHAADGRLVFGVSDRTGNATEEDCHLIAAAPDLLAALRVFLEFDEAGELPGDFCFGIARAAIAKATGDGA